MTDKRPQLHASGMGLLTNCGEAWRRRYIEGEVVPPSAALIIGSATHASIDINLSNKIENGELLDVGAVREIAADMVQTSFDGGDVMLEKGESKGKAAGVAKDMAVSLSELHHADVAPWIDPESVETSFLIHAEGYPFDLAGTYDVLEHGGVVRDTKTCKAKMSQAKADGSVQFDAYAFAYKLTRGELPKRMVFDNLVKTKVPKYVEVETVRDDGDTQCFLRRFEAACKVIEAGVFLPADPTQSWLCGPRYCGYWSTCVFAKGRGRPQT